MAMPCPKPNEESGRMFYIIKIKFSFLKPFLLWLSREGF